VFEEALVDRAEVADVQVPVAHWTATGAAGGLGPGEFVDGQDKVLVPNLPPNEERVLFGIKQPAVVGRHTEVGIPLVHDPEELVQLVPTVVGRGAE